MNNNFSFVDVKENRSRFILVDPENVHEHFARFDRNVFPPFCGFRDNEFHIIGTFLCDDYPGFHRSYDEPDRKYEKIEISNFTKSEEKNQGFVKIKSYGSELDQCTDLDIKRLGINISGFVLLDTDSRYTFAEWVFINFIDNDATIQRATMYAIKYHCKLFDNSCRFLNETKLRMIIKSYTQTPRQEKND